jgi:tetratricopeptide (TPR) repeat protein
MSRRLFIAMSIVWTLVTPGHPAAQGEASSKSELLAKTYQAQILLDQYYGKHSSIVQAQTQIVEVLKADGRFVPAYVQAARATIMGGHIVGHRFEGGSLETAESILMQAKAIEPATAEVYVLLGHVYYLKGDMGGAIEWLNKAKQLQSANPWLNNNYGDVYLKLKNYELAEWHYQIVEKLGIGITPQQRRAYIHALQKRQWLAALREDNAEVLRIGKLATDAAPPEDAWTWGEVADVLFIQGFFDESIDHSRHALGIMNYGVGRNNLALGLYGKWASLVVQGRAIEGEKYFAEAFSLQPDLTQVVHRFRRSADPVFNLIPIVERRQAELRSKTTSSQPTM